MATKPIAPPLLPPIGLNIPLRPAVLVFVAMLFAAIAAYVLTPQRSVQAATPDLETLVPTSFGNWKEIPSPYVQVSLATHNPEAPSRDQPYDAVLMRTYATAAGSNIMLALAYAGEQRQDIKIHRPEVCYPAQGFEVIEQQAAAFPIVGSALPVSGTRLLVRNRQRLEAVSYWIRVGEAFPRSAWAMRAQIFRAGLAGQVSDGILVRASSLIDDPSQAAAAYAEQQRFLSGLVPEVAAHAPGLMVPVLAR
jgi:EpsI family protein